MMNFLVGKKTGHTGHLLGTFEVFPILTISYRRNKKLFLLIIASLAENIIFQQINVQSTT